MTRAVRTLVAVDPALDVDGITRSVPLSENLQVVGVHADLDDARTRLEQTPFDVLLVAAAGYSERALLLIDAAQRLDPQPSVLVLSEGSSNGFVRRLLEHGADDILMLPQSQEQIAFAVRKVITRKDTSSDQGLEPARIVVVLGPKGGTGKTLTATNLAVALQGIGNSVSLVDLDLQFGDVALTLGLPPESTIHDLAVSGGALDQEMLDHYLVRHTSGVKTLLAPNRPDHASAVSSELIREIFSLLRQVNDYVIVDTPPGFTAEVIQAIDASTDLVMVGMLDSLSLKNTKLGLETLRLMGYENGAVKLVLNRAHSRVGISVSDVISVLGREPDVYVPSDREIPRAVNEGVTIVTSRPDSEAANAFRELAYKFAGVAAGTAAAPSQARRRLFGRRS